MKILASKLIEKSQYAKKTWEAHENSSLSTTSQNHMCYNSKEKIHKSIENELNKTHGFQDYWFYLDLHNSNENFDHENLKR